MTDADAAVDYAVQTLVDAQQRAADAAGIAMAAATDAYGTAKTAYDAAKLAYDGAPTVATAEMLRDAAVEAQMKANAASALAATGTAEQMAMVGHGSDGC